MQQRVGPERGRGKRNREAEGWAVHAHLQEGKVGVVSREHNLKVAHHHLAPLIQLVQGLVLILSIASHTQPIQSPRTHCKNGGRVGKLNIPSVKSPSVALSYIQLPLTLPTRGLRGWGLLTSLALLTRVPTVLIWAARG